MTCSLLTHATTDPSTARACATIVGHNNLLVKNVSFGVMNDLLLSRRGTPCAWFTVACDEVFCFKNI